MTTIAEIYTLGPARRLINKIAAMLLRSPVSPRHYSLLTVTGRRSGRPYSTPVRPVDVDGQRYLIAPYGPVSWVRNARGAGQVDLTHAGTTDTVAIVEEPPAVAGPVLRAYAQAVPVTRPYFDARPDEPIEKFAAEAGRHPVFPSRRRPQASAVTRRPAHDHRRSSNPYTAGPRSVRTSRERRSCRWAPRPSQRQPTNCGSARRAAYRAGTWTTSPLDHRTGRS